MKRYHTQSQTAPVPGAGLGVVIRPSPVQRVKISSVIATFAAGAAVANRLLFAQICDPNNVPVFETGSPTAIVANGVTDLVLSPVFSQPNAIQGPVNAAIGLGIPSLWLPPAWSLKISAVAIQAADQFSGITYLAEFAEDVWDQEHDEAQMIALLAALAS